MHEVGLHRLGLKKWPFAIVIPIVVMSTAYLVLWATPYASVRNHVLTGTVALLLPLKLLFLVIYYTITSSLGEEIGWRGYLLPKLAELGWNKAFILSGVIHALFHFLLFFTGSYHDEGNPWFVIPMFVITLVFIGVIFGYVRVSSNSVWPAAIMPPDLIIINIDASWKPAMFIHYM
ncbi:CPBP family glutamic-type intramembrane protease [Brevibacillus fluminis]|uniref:CPBP family glutamic-type intramembrane protease n=1 Tax=Brevibacillus fluminis TaxID=511487 RepID=UPI003F89335E